MEKGRRGLDTAAKTDMIELGKTTATGDGQCYDDGVIPEPLYDLVFEDGTDVPVSLY